MSNEAINWALGQPVSKSSAKFVLVAMANLAGAESTCWPSYKHLTAATSQDVKTVQAGLRRLREDGYITDTGERKGITGQVIVYRLNTPEFGGVTPPIKTPEIPAKTPETGGLSEVSKTPVFPGNTPVFPEKHPQISRETPPKTGDGTTKDTTRNHQDTKEVKPDVSALLADVDPQFVTDYLKVRKAKKAGPLTPTAVTGLRREAAKAGISCEQAVQACCEFGWQGFNAGWYSQRTVGTPAARPAGKHTGFQKLDYREGVNPDGSFV
ncbi:MAG: helix-turn-helix domain-containing protein [Janthinobacterium lividum]